MIKKCPRHNKSVYFESIIIPN